MYYTSMENILNLEKIARMEEKISHGVNLLEITKTFCECNYDQSKEIPALISILEVILDNQRMLLDALEDILAS